MRGHRPGIVRNRSYAKPLKCNAFPTDDDPRTKSGPMNATEP